MPSKCVTWSEARRGSWDLLSCFGVRPWNQLCAGGYSLGRFFSLLWLVGWCLGTWLVEQEQLFFKLAFLGDWFTALLGKIWSNRFFPPHQGIEAALCTPGFFREWCARMICRLQEEQWACKLRDVLHKDSAQTNCLSLPFACNVGAILKAECPPGSILGGVKVITCDSHSLFSLSLSLWIRLLVSLISLVLLILACHLMCLDWNLEKRGFWFTSQK